jgi:Sulfotransferase domain
MPVRFPDFLIAGAPRAGTTWLYHLLDHHPEVYMAKPVRPEPKFFLVDELYKRGMEYYAHTWFPQSTDAKVAGEKSTNYLESRIVAQRIHTHLPHVKLIFMLREPVERAFSNYCWSRMYGLEEADFPTALALEEQRQRELPERWCYARPHAYFSRGLYAEMLWPYLELFPREHILCLRYEDISEAPEQLAERLHVFLGIHPRPEDTRNLGMINASCREHLTMSLSLRARLRQRYAEPNRQLAQLLGPSFQLWES